MKTVHDVKTDGVTSMSKDLELSCASFSEDARVLSAINVLRPQSVFGNYRSLALSADSSSTPSPKSLSYSEQRQRFKHSPDENLKDSLQFAPHTPMGCYMHSLPLTHWDVGKGAAVCSKCRNNGSIETVFSALIKESRTNLLGSIERGISGLESVLGDLRQSQTVFQREARNVRRLIEEELSGWLSRIDREEDAVRIGVGVSVREVAERKKRLGEILRDLMDAETFHKTDDMVEFLRIQPSMAEAVSVLTEPLSLPLMEGDKIEMIRKEWETKGRREVDVFTPDLPAELRTELRKKMGRLTASFFTSKVSSLLEIDEALRKDGELNESEIQEILVFLERYRTSRSY